MTNGRRTAHWMAKVGCHAALAAAAWLGAERAAEARDVVESYQTWGSFTFQKNWKDVSFYFDMTNRFYDDFTPSNQQLRPALAFRLGKGRFLYLGYVFSPAWGDKVIKAADSEDGVEHREHPFINEHRIWQQLTNDVTFKGVNVFLRSRLEERFRPEASQAVGLRARQLLRFLVPSIGFPLRLSVWDEILIGVNDANNNPDAAGAVTRWQGQGFDQNRFFVGPSLDFMKIARVEAGYFMQYQRPVVPHGAAPAADQMRHAVLVQWFVTLN